jgi:hypothetical protein
MESLDAQCLVIDLITGEGGPTPDRWQHRRDGTLAYRFGNSPRTFSWWPEAVAEMAERWRRSRRSVPPAIAQLVAGHRAFVNLLASAEVEQPWSIVHDLRTSELTACWGDDRPLVVIGPDQRA